MSDSPALPSPAGPVPTPAERARTLLEFGSSVILDVPGIDLANRPGIPPLVRCAVLPDGALAVLAEHDSPLCRIASVSRQEEVAGLLEAVDVAPVAMPHRIRGRATVHGRLTALRPAAPEVLDGLFPYRPAGQYALLRFDPDHLSVEDLWGADCCVDLTGFGRAATDPLAAEEATVLQHLASAHADQLALLGAQALDHPSGLRSWPDPGRYEVRPVSLDRFGLRVRLLAEDRVLDARFEFHRPVTGPEELAEAMHRLFSQVRTH
ncbi:MULTISPECIES: DUF2470 domain-containing protein [unclassified Kitasatospora]|uniref:DUF2470 domain-containing protein n=1 Tax=unclassified Kitasatospora TaxID=2633591 RepID=UPI00070E6C9B|nr:MULTISPECIES: DUF2470 domain-containing protein [unclassified Kitasatospora]KQV21822.1 hypothetical protein ASC99_19285 [Kitasatospora sp. Root107]KRB75386.1 hypothetical protein ASE03_15470 [Kitasatospora sp. Root187]